MQQKKFGFPISPVLYNKTHELIKKVKAAKDKRPFALQIFECVEAISNVGLDYFFVKPLKRAKMNAIMTKTFEMAVNMGQSSILKVGKTLIKSMDGTQLMVIIDLLEESMSYAHVDINPQQNPPSPKKDNIEEDVNNNEKTE